MRQLKEPFHSKNYTFNEKRKKFEPLLEVLVGTKEMKKEVIALVDTGCSTCMHFCKSYIDKEGLVFMKKINKHPIPFGVADGHTINGDYYKAICQIGGEEREIIVSVIDPESFFEKEEPEIGIVKPLLGRDVLDNYDTLFKGKKRQIALFHSE
jgi:hypothetical protein